MLTTRVKLLKNLACSFLYLNLVIFSTQDEFIFNGFRNWNLAFDGTASFTSDGLLRLNAIDARYTTSHSFYQRPLSLIRKSPTGDVLPFSTTFVFAIRSDFGDLNGQGFAFTISPTTDFSTAYPSQYLGVFNPVTIGNSSNHIFAVELDTLQNFEFGDIDDNHVGIDINGLVSNASHTAGYYDSSTGVFKGLRLSDGNPMQVWIDYSSTDMQLDVTLSPINIPKPNRPLLRSNINLSTVILDSMYVGFSSSTGSAFTSHYILGWSFKTNGVAQALNYTDLPSLPPIPSVRQSKHLQIWLSVSILVLLVVVIIPVAVSIMRRRKFTELREEWEMEYGPHRFRFKDLFTATRGFKDKEVLGVGGFGKVYRGVLPVSGLEIAVKRVSHDSRQGIKEFIAEIVSIGRLRHRNIVRLLGYCRRKGELLLVYDYMPNWSLDKYLRGHSNATLDWAQRFRIIKGVASGLLYLHEEWEQVVVHRDIKASNVLLDGEMNGRLGDFGLARLYDHGAHLQTTHVAGTMGYIAPELSRTGKATTITDVYAFGAFLLEVACGRRPIEPGAGEEQLVLVDWVLENWRRGSILETRDSRLVEGLAEQEKEIELVLKLGLLCSHPLPMYRPSMRQVMQFLDGDAPLPELLPNFMDYSMLATLQNDGLEDCAVLYRSGATASSLSLSVGR